MDEQAVAKKKLYKLKPYQVPIPSKELYEALSKTMQEATKITTTLNAETPEIPKKTPKTLSSILPPIEPLTVDQWEKMNGKARWDSVVALRGPDMVNSNILKWFTNSIIRHKMSGIMRVGGLVNQSIPFVVIPAPPHREKGSFDAQHFLDHIHVAAVWLGIKVVQAPRSAWEIILGASSTYQAEKALASLLPDPFKEYLVTKTASDIDDYLSPPPEESPDAESD